MTVKHVYKINNRKFKFCEPFVYQQINDIRRYYTERGERAVVEYMGAEVDCKPVEEHVGNGEQLPF